MSSRLTTSDRVMLLMSLVPYLKEHGPTQVSELASMFGVDAPAVRKLVRFLGVAGVPGETQTYQHEDLFDIDWDALEQHDIVSLTQTVAVDETPRFSSVETSAMIAGLHALTPMLPGEMQEAAVSAAKKLASVRAADGGQGAVSITEDAAQQRIAEITSAISEHTRLSFEYRSADGTLSQRTVEPLLLSQSGGAWYLRAYCIDRCAERTFLLDRMRSPRALPEKAVHLVGKRVVAPVALGVEGAELTARVRLTRLALQRLIDFAPRVLAEGDEGWLTAEVDLLHPGVAERLVQAAPGEVIVEQPEAARAAVHEWAERALSAYDA